MFERQFLLFYYRYRKLKNKIKTHKRKMDKENLKIGFLSFYHPHLGGSGIVATRLAQNLIERGHEIHFIGYDTDENPGEMEDLGVKLHRVRKIDYPCLKNEPYSWTLASRLINIHNMFNLDLVHAHYAIPHGLSAFIAREQLKRKNSSLPYVVTGHGSDIHTNGKKEDVNPILQLSLNEADALTFVSKDLQKIAENSLGITKDSEVIPNFVDTDFFYKKPSDLKERLGIPKNAFVIGHVSNFAPIKQVYHFSYLAEHLKADGMLDNVYFLMCGDGREKPSLEERMMKIDAWENCRFCGIMDSNEIAEAYNVMDVFVLPSKHEGNPLTILEAMACQVPVIGTRVGGIEETIENGGGFLFPSGDIRSLLKMIYTLKNNSKIGHQIGKKSLEKIKKDHSSQKIVDQYLGVYEKITGNKSKKEISSIK